MAAVDIIFPYEEDDDLLLRRSNAYSDSWINDAPIVVFKGNISKHAYSDGELYLVNDSNYFVYEISNDILYKYSEEDFHSRVPDNAGLKWYEHYI